MFCMILAGYFFLDAFCLILAIDPPHTILSNELQYGIQIPYPYGVSDPLESPKQLKDLVMGDLVLTSEQMQNWKYGLDMSSNAKKNGKRNKLWPKGKIPYEIDCSLKKIPRVVGAIKEAMSQWQANTCVQFKERINEKDYLLFVRDSGCWANVGRIGGISQVSIGIGCAHAHLIIHLVGHILGLWHQHNRMDRDKYVKIFWQNINAYTRMALRRVEDTVALSGEYDYASIMHYPFDAFSNNGRRTMLPLKRSSNAPFKTISNLDALQIDEMYKCESLGTERKKRRIRSRRSIFSEHIDRACFDKNLRCSEWALAGHCQGNRYVIENCKSSCKVPCGRRNADGNCQDSYQSCTVWERSGFCSRPKIAKACKFSCDPACKPSVNCKDSGDFCKRITFQRDCVNDWLQKFCTLSCDPKCASKRVRTYKKSACVDKFAFCKRWSSLGYCEKYKRALKACPASCKPECKISTTKRIPPTIASLYEKMIPTIGTKQIEVSITSELKGAINFGHGVLCTDRHERCQKLAKRCGTDLWVDDNCKKTCNSKDCDKFIPQPKGACSSSLGLSFNGGPFRISDSSFTASSYFKSNGWSAKPENARLYFMDDAKSKRIGGWCVSPVADNNSNWLQVDLSDQKTVTFIATQGRDKHFERVEEFTISYSNDGIYFEKYEENRKIKIFKGNCDHFTPVINEFKEPLIARYIRVYPVKFNTACMRLEFYGC